MRIKVLLFLLLLCLQTWLVQGRVFTVPSPRGLLLPRTTLTPPTVATAAAAAAASAFTNKQTFSPSSHSGSNAGSATATATASYRFRDKFSPKHLIIPLAGSLAASTAELLTYPLDVAKVNMQVSRGNKFNKSGQEIGILDLLSSIVVVNGFFGLWRGFPAALLRQICYQVLKVLLFEPLTTLLVLLSGADSPAVMHMLLGGGLAGTLGAFLTTPFDRVKVRSQILGTKAVGGGSGSTAEGLREIFQAMGHLDWPRIAGLYTGASANCQRAFLLNAAELTSYKVVKQALIRQNSSWLRVNKTMDNAYTHLVSALCSGFIASAVSAPIDRAKTLIITSPRNTYSGMLDCLSDIFINQGLVGLYRGFFATWLRLAPFTILFFLSFEYFKSLFHRIN